MKNKTLLADSHAHVLGDRLRERADDIVVRLESDGLAFIVEVGYCFTQSQDSYYFARRHKNVYCTLGVHPHDATDYSDAFEQWVRGVVPNEKIVAIGEVGLDYHYMHSPKQTQRDVFVRQIKLAHELGLSLVVHSRDAFDDTYEVLLTHKELIRNGILFHCFGYGPNEAKKLTDEFDAYFAFGGALTYKTAIETVEALKVVPRNRILLETDCPYLSPCNLRGMINEPKNIWHTAKFAADLLDIELDEFAELTLRNTKDFYRI